MPSFQTWQDFLQVDDVREMSNVLDKTSITLQSQYAASKRIGNLGKFFQKVASPSSAPRSRVS